MADPLGGIVKLYGAFDKLTKVFDKLFDTEKKQTDSTLKSIASLTSLQSSISTLVSSNKALVEAINALRGVFTGRGGNALTAGAQQAVESSKLTDIGKFIQGAYSSGKTSGGLASHLTSAFPPAALPKAKGIDDWLDELRRKALGRGPGKGLGVDLGVPKGKDLGIDLSGLGPGDVKGDKGKGPQWMPSDAEEAVKKSTAAVDENAGAFTGLLGKLGAVGLSALAVVEALKLAGAAMTSFVQALAPAEIRYLQKILANLAATIGLAFEPAVQAITAALTNLWLSIGPLMMELAGPIRDLTEAIINLLAGPLELVGAVLEPLIPLIDFLGNYFKLLGEWLSVFVKFLNIVLLPLAVLGPLLQEISDVFSDLSPVLEAIGDAFDDLSAIIKTVVQVVGAWIGSLFGGVNVKGMFEGLAKVIGKFVAWIVLFIAELAKQFGYLNFVKQLQKNLEPEKSAAAAVGPVSIKSFEDISKELATSAFGAAGKAGGENQWKADLKKGLDDIVAGTEENNKTLVNMMTDIHVIAGWMELIAHPTKALDTEVKHGGQHGGFRAIGDFALWAAGFGK